VNVQFWVARGVDTAGLYNDRRGPEEAAQLFEGRGGVAVDLDRNYGAFKDVPDYA
jgi:hypothetical protein